MDYEDKPKPAKDYLLLVYLLFGGILALVILASLAVWRQNPPLLVIMAFPCLIIMLVGTGLLHAAYRTSYTLADGRLVARCGIFSSVIRLDAVEEIQHAGYIRKPLGWGMGCRGFCNRLRDGIKLQLRNESIYLSPSDPALFTDTIRRLLPDEETKGPIADGR